MTRPAVLRGWATLLAALLVSVLAGLAIADAAAGGPVIRRLATQLGLPLFTPPTVVVVDAAPPRIEVRDGTATIADLARAGEDAGHGDLVTRGDGAWTVLADVAVLDAARLDLRDVVVRSSGGLESRGGEIDIRAAEVVGWDPALDGGGGPDTRPADGRAWIAARDAGVLRIADSDLRHLGDGAPGRDGVAWLGPGTTGRLTGSQVVDVHAVALRDADVVSVDATEVRDSVGDGLLQTGGGAVAVSDVLVVDPGRDGIRLQEARGGSVTGAVVQGAAGAGIAVTDDSVGVTIDGVEIHGGGGAGMLVHDTQGVVFRDAVVYDNTLGVVVEGAAVRTEVVASRVAGNAEEGVFVRNGAEATVVRDNHIDRNGRAGLALVGADVTVVSNVLAENADGVRIGAQPSTGAITDNEITGNIEDGVDLPEVDTVAVRGNLIADNRHGAFSVLTAGRSDGVAAANTLRENGDGQERIRER